MLQHIFHMSMLIGSLPNFDTREKMMNLLNTRGNKDWTAEYILQLATNNKITWVKGYNDPTNYDTYQQQMNARLAEILSE